MNGGVDYDADVGASGVPCAVGDVVCGRGVRCAWEGSDVHCTAVWWFLRSGASLSWWGRGFVTHLQFPSLTKVFQVHGCACYDDT